MGTKNHTIVTSFILFGMSDLPEHQILLFLVFLILYLLNLLGNIIMITLIVIDPQLKTPMYFFLCNLSFADMCLATVNVPNLLANFFSKSKNISYSGCITQMHFFLITGIAECFLLSAMAYDRYVAICKPLHYTLVMNRKLCNLIAAGCWTIAYLHSLLHTLLLSQLSFCGPNTIDHFFCDLLPLFKLSCSDISTNEIVIYMEGSIIGCGTFLCILMSYICIFITIFGIRSSEGRHKAFSTCSSHLIVVTLYFGSGSFTYFQPSSSYTHERNRVMTVMYTVVTPMLNPYIYSLRNNDVKGALRRTIARNLISIQTCKTSVLIKV
uniref:Olfactory receptor n=1 Tax=Geotrypetes seraphini TaxID=260995 RepID=A0A6P8SGL5_GEOSA|nr:olfactory receptor 1361-like [Geotrypetes seraphini]